MCDYDELFDACAFAFCPIHQAAEFAHPPRVDLHVRVAGRSRITMSSVSYGLSLALYCSTSCRNPQTQGRQVWRLAE
jgi:hypothetical protein